MAGTLNSTTTQGSTLQPGRPNMHLLAVRQSAAKLSGKRWEQMERPCLEVEPVEFPPVIEWTQTTRLHFEVTGFNFTGDPELKNKNGKAPPGEAAISVSELLAESPAEAPPMPPVIFQSIVWDEIDEVTAEPSRPISKLAAALELFEPPASTRTKPETRKEPQPPVKPASQANDILVAPDPEPELEAFTPPPQAGLLPGKKPALRKPAASKPVWNAEPLAPAGSRIHIPTAAILPLRPAMAAGPVPGAAAPPAHPVLQVPVVEAPKPEDGVVEQKPVEIVQPAPQQHGRGKKHKRGNRNGGGRAGQGDDRIEEPLDLGEEIEAEIAAAKAHDDSRARLVPSKKEDAGQAAARPLRPGGSPDPEAKTAAKHEITSGLNLGSSIEARHDLFMPVTGMGWGAKIGIAAAVLVVAGGIAAFTMGSSSRKPNSVPISGVAVGTVETAGTVMGEAGWSTDYALDGQGKRVRQLSFYRPSMQISDYRVEFQAEMEYKAVSWVVRATDIRTHYVLKLAQIGGPGDVQLVRFPVLHGKPGETVIRKMPFPTHVGMSYRVRTDVVGSRFSVTVNDKLVDQWKDEKMAGGGFGVANEGAERGQVQAIQMWHLRDRPPVNR
ncbi:MAG TPA: hypothetical protein VM120_03280 [Bryobacteraceae bacterium]|nr:hypothetical protein [Bryobacteraceae bacterium]